MAKAIMFLSDAFLAMLEAGQGVFEFISEPFLWPSWAGSTPSWWPADITLFELMLGTGLIFYITFVVIKFFLDIIL